MNSTVNSKTSGTVNANVNTPLNDFLVNYSNEKKIRLHMPGHKGRFFSDKLFYECDITEIAGADSLYEANGIIRESEKNAEKLFRSGTTVYSASGSTLCIQAMVYLMKCEGRRIFYVGNPHRAFWNVCKLLGIVPKKLPENEVAEEEKSTISAKPKHDFAEIPNAEKLAIYITSPDYFGNITDIEKYRQADVKILVDNAHGAHLAFYEDSRHPLHHGADLVCDSAHKMLPVLTGGAYLHSSEPNMSKTLKNAMAMFGSTSPSYLILQSLDLCNTYLDKHIRDDIKRTSKLLGDSKIRDCYHMVVRNIPEILKYITPEFVNDEYMILLFSPLNTDEEIKFVLNILEKYDSHIDIRNLKLGISEYNSIQ
jgi:arginine/lysine/ornithine decarboxylase